MKIRRPRPFAREEIRENKYRMQRKLIIGQPQFSRFRLVTPIIIWPERDA